MADDDFFSGVVATSRYKTMKQNRPAFHKSGTLPVDGESHPKLKLGKKKKDLDDARGYREGTMASFGATGFRELPEDPDAKFLYRKSPQ